MRYLITGGCGFLGSNIGASILRDGDGLVIFDDLSRVGSTQNLEWLRSLGSFEFVHGDIRERNDVESVIRESKVDMIYHLAGQVAMTTSIANPRKDFDTNAVGGFNILESVRLLSPETGVIYSSTNKVYGDLDWVELDETDTRYVARHFPKGFPETIPLHFHSPYGNSKGCADQYMLDYARIFGLKTAVFRHSSMYGGRQFATHDQGWIGWFCQKALETKSGVLQEPFTIAGNGKQVRDLLHAEDAVELYLRAAQKIDAIRGEAFNIGGGMGQSLSLLELFEILQDELDTHLSYRILPARTSDQKVFVADLSKVQRLLGWAPATDKISGLRKMIDWTRSIRA